MNRTLVVTGNQMKVLKKALGLNMRKRIFRNHYVDKADSKVCNQLVHLGAMVKVTKVKDDTCFFAVTNFGKEIAIRGATMDVVANIK